MQLDFGDLLLYLAAAPIVLWVAGAIYFDLAAAKWQGVVLAIGWIGLSFAMFGIWQPAWQPLVVVLFLAALFSWWWFLQEPSHFRKWDRNFARLPHVAIAGDLIEISDIRNTEYLPHAESIPRYETRTYALSRLCGADLLIATWGYPWMCHPMFVFDFGQDGRLCVSIEVRYRVGQKYSLLRSFYRQQELMFVVCDERDAILRRTKWLDSQDLHLYRVNADAITLRRFFFEYASTINSLSAKPRWYHGFATNCTTSIYAQGRGHMTWHWRMVINGGLDQLMYDRGLLRQDIPFSKLKESSWINDVANVAPKDGFGDYLRRHLAGYSRQHELTSDNPATHLEMNSGLA